MTEPRKEAETWGVFADELRAHREGRGWSQAVLAARIHYSESLIAQVETCRKPPSMILAEKLDAVFATPGYRPAKNGGEASPGTFMRLGLKLRKMTFSAPFGSFAFHEATADEMYAFEHSLIPGQLQTEPYARAVLKTRPNTTEDELDALVESRIARAEILTRTAPPAPMCWYLIDEGALHRPVAPPAEMCKQLEHLIEISALPNVTIQVLPYAAGGHTGLLGACVIAETTGQAGIVYLEDMSDGRVSEDPATVHEITLRFKSLQSEALPQSASRQLIRGVAETWTP